jgi:hypothetical protein
MKTCYHADKTVGLTNGTTFDILSIAAGPFAGHSQEAIGTATDGAVFLFCN